MLLGGGKGEIPLRRKKTKFESIFLPTAITCHALIDPLEHCVSSTLSPVSLCLIGCFPIAQKGAPDNGHVAFLRPVFIPAPFFIPIPKFVVVALSSVTPTCWTASRRQTDMGASVRLAVCCCRFVASCQGCSW